jgi:hypothetical protein
MISIAAEISAAISSPRPQDWVVTIERLGSECMAVEFCLHSPDGPIVRSMPEEGVGTTVKDQLRHIGYR